MKRLIKQSLTRIFHLGQRFGVDILPRHFYSEIPAIFRLRHLQHWREPYSLIDLPGSDAEEQLAFVRQTMTPPIVERLREFDVHREAGELNGETGYGGPIEAQFLYAFVCTHRPARIIQIGCGVSTAVCLAAARDAKYDLAITCIDPYPTSFLNSAARDGRIRLVSQPVELMPLDFLGELQAGDLFFVDSTHTLGPAGEVTRIVLEMLPRLSDGVFAHFHDIWLPYDFEPGLLENKVFFWHETALLMAFLCCNNRFRIRASLSLLHHARPRDLAQIFVNYRPMKSHRGIRTAAGHYPNAIYLQSLSATA